MELEVAERMRKRNISMQCFCKKIPEVVNKSEWPRSSEPSLVDKYIDERLFKYVVRCPSTTDKCVWCYYV